MSKEKIVNIDCYSKNSFLIENSIIDSDEDSHEIYIAKKHARHWIGQFHELCLDENERIDTDLTKFEALGALRSSLCFLKSIDKNNKDIYAHMLSDHSIFTREYKIKVRTNIEIK